MLLVASDHEVKCTPATFCLVHTAVGQLMSSSVGVTGMITTRTSQN